MDIIYFSDLDEGEEEHLLLNQQILSDQACYEEWLASQHDSSNEGEEFQQ